MTEKQQRILNDLGPNAGPVRRAVGLLMALDEKTLESVLSTLKEVKAIKETEK